MNCKNLIKLRFLITIGETHAKTMRPAARTATGYDNEFTFTPLFPCNNYTIDVCAANLNEVTSEKIIMYASTEETGNVVKAVYLEGKTDSWHVVQIYSYM